MRVEGVYFCAEKVDMLEQMPSVRSLLWSPNSPSRRLWVVSSDESAVGICECLCVCVRVCARLFLQDVVKNGEESKMNKIFGGVNTESTLYSGKAVAALAMDKNVMRCGFPVTFAPLPPFSTLKKLWASSPIS